MMLAKIGPFSVRNSPALLSKILVPGCRRKHVRRELNALEPGVNGIGNGGDEQAYFRESSTPSNKMFPEPAFSILALLERVRDPPEQPDQDTPYQVVWPRITLRICSSIWR